jgi:hypothetical protein
MTERLPTEPGAPLYGRLLAMSRVAHGRGQHSVAYHALAAAMHAADDAGDVDALAEVGRHAHPGVYAMLVRQTTAHELMHGHRPTAASARPAG